MGSALPHIAIYMYTKFYLNATRSFKIIRWTSSQTAKAGLYASPFGEHDNVYSLYLIDQTEENSWW